MHFSLGKPDGARLTIPSLRVASSTEVAVLGAPGRLLWSQAGADMVIETGSVPGEYAWGLKISPAPLGA